MVGKEKKEDKMEECERKRKKMSRRMIIRGIKRRRGRKSRLKG